MRNASFALSFPFTAGIALCHFMLGILPGAISIFPGLPLSERGGIYTAGIISAAALSGTLVFFFRLVIRRARPYLSTGAMFFCLGVFCCSLQRIIPHEGVQGALLQGRTLAGALDALRARIAGHPFSDTAGTAALLEALLTGRKAALSRDAVAAFRAAGAAHILALSGLHLGVISAVLDRCLTVLGNSRAAWAVRSAIVVAAGLFYTLMCGAGPSLVRALIFITLAQLRRLSPGREGGGAQTLCTALVVQLALRPSWISDTAFQLSYLSMCGIFFLYPKLENWHPAAGERGNATVRIWNAMALSLSCQIFTAPLVFFTFGTLPRHFLLANLIALPLTEVLISVAVAALLLPGTTLPCRLLCRACDCLAAGLGDSMRIIATM